MSVETYTAIALVAMWIDAVATHLSGARYRLLTSFLFAAAWPVVMPLGICGVVRWSRGISTTKSAEDAKEGGR